MRDLLEPVLRELLANPEGVASPDGVKIGYARVSTDDQRLDLQFDALRKAGVADENIYSEYVSGAAKKRPELDRAFRALRPGDTFVVWRLDRLARSLSELLHRLETLDRRKIAFMSISEHHTISTGSAIGKLIIHVIGAIAEFERQLGKERTTAGMEASKRRGTKLGAPRKVDVEKARQRFREGALLADVAREQGVTKNAIRTYVTSIEIAALHAAGERARRKKGKR